VGANAAIFSVGYAMLAHPLPYAGADRLIMLRSTNPSHGVSWTTAAPANLLDWQAQAKSFEAIAGYRWWSADLTGGDHSERLRGLFITPEFFTVLDIPLMGRRASSLVRQPWRCAEARRTTLHGRTRAAASGRHARRFGSGDDPVLLIATGLMVKSANRLWQIDPGFNPQQLLTMTISLPNNKFEWRHNVVFSRQVIGSIEAMPGIRAAAVFQGVPMRAGSFLTSFSVEGRPDTPVDRPSGRLRVVSPGYFGVMRIPILAGRDHDEHDEAGDVGSLPSVIVNRTLAERCWPGGDAVGKRVRMSWKSSRSIIIAIHGRCIQTSATATFWSSSCERRSKTLHTPPATANAARGRSMGTGHAAF
jgi:hypothetical protein